MVMKPVAGKKKENELPVGVFVFSTVKSKQGEMFIFFIIRTDAKVKHEAKD